MTVLRRSRHKTITSALDAAVVVPPVPPVSAIAPRRSPSITGRRPPNYPDLNFTALSAAVGCTATHLGRIMNGRTRPSLKVAEKLGALLNWTIDQVNELYKNPKPKEKSHNEKTRGVKRSGGRTGTGTKRVPDVRAKTRLFDARPHG